ncbi:hypothetical protein [Paraburkholderia bryophila]|uniref:Uncharacterized protein n=1 Tax=Paraburkholderia bryophila TaxID=420952 RepID=A0A7Y9WV94_9BURK|nr:hypothetical protein [Paraburkholderia bryophila]NYH27824.1 hypothetical protein [Paraburkholderia bryophila]
MTSRYRTRGPVEAWMAGVVMRLPPAVVGKSLRCAMLIVVS